MHEENIHVHVIQEKDRKNLTMRYVDPVTGKQVKKSARTSKMKEARARAAVWEHELRAGKYVATSKLTWKDFRSRYESEVVPSLAAKTGKMVATVFNSVERIVSPKRLGDMTAARISAFQAKLRDEQRAESTIKAYLAHLKSALRWAVDVGMLPSAPKIPRLKRAKVSKVMKGRPITTEEFERMMLKAREGVFGKVKRNGGNEPTPEQVEREQAIVAAWQYYLEGLWWSGLRLAESLELYWDRPDRLCVDLSGRRPMLRIPAELEKGNKDRLLPITPEFAEFLSATPAEQRRGRVFKLPGSRGRGTAPRPRWVSKIVSRIGQAANAKVDEKLVTDPKTGETKAKVKYASAHDLRRSFGERWAVRVMPQVLKELMRHESIETTMRYYVGRNAHTTADAVWEAYEAKLGEGGTTLGTRHPMAQNTDGQETTEVLAREGLRQCPP